MCIDGKHYSDHLKRKLTSRGELCDCSPMENTLKSCSAAAASSYQHAEAGGEHVVLDLVLVNGEGFLKELVAGSNLG